MTRLHEPAADGPASGVPGVPGVPGGMAVEREDSGRVAGRLLPIRLVCAGCGHRVPDDIAFIARCPSAVDGDDIDHVLRRELVPGAVTFPPAAGAFDPVEPTFVRYRTLLRAYHVARAAGWPDARFVELASRLDAEVAVVAGTGFRETPFEPAGALGRRAGLVGGAVWVKDETRNVSGSHKARHLMGIMLELLVADQCGPTAGRRSGGLDVPRLAIASCGNAALAAAVVARAAGRPLDVFVPTWADAAIAARLRSLGAEVVACPRPAGETGDPTYRRLREAIAAGSVPFTCQGNENGLAIEGGQTLGYEMVGRLARDSEAHWSDAGGGRRLDAVVVQVGGGALASAVAGAFAEARGFGVIDREPRLYAVQTEGCAPLARAWRRFHERAAVDGPEAALAHASRHRSEHMRPWESEPASAAHGILDDETYDWLAIVEAMERTGGGVAVVDEATILAANDLGRESTGIDVDHTGTAGLAGLLALLRTGDIRPDDTVAVLFTGVRRHEDRDAATLVTTAAPLRPKESS